MNVGIDARALNVRGGVQRYARNLIEHLQDRSDINISLYKQESRIGKWVDRTPLRLFYENLYLPYKSFTEDIDIFHGLKHVVPPVSGVPRVVTVHDVLPFLKSKSYNTYNRIWGRIWRHYVDRAERIIAVSRSTKQDLVDVLSTDPEKIDVIHEGVSSRFFEAEPGEELRSFLDSKGADTSNEVFNILFTGTMKPQKNVKRVIKTFENLCEDRKEVQLLLAGKEGWKSGYPGDYISSSEWESRIKRLGFVPDKILPELYAYSDLFVFPSMYEGFGLPPLEAMAAGTPVVASDNSSMKEVVGEAGNLVDPESAQAIQEAIEELYEDRSLREEVGKKGRKRADKFRWEEVVEETVDTYRDVLSES